MHGGLAGTVGLELGLDVGVVEARLPEASR
jgi:hypothetical protein